MTICFPELGEKGVMIPNMKNCHYVDPVLKFNTVSGIILLRNCSLILFWFGEDRGKWYNDCMDGVDDGDV